MVKYRSFIIHVLAVLLVVVISEIGGLGIGSEVAYADPLTTPTAGPTNTPQPTATSNPAVVSAEINMDPSVTVAPDKNLFLPQ